MLERTNLHQLLSGLALATLLIAPGCSEDTDRPAGDTSVSKRDRSIVSVPDRGLADRKTSLLDTTPRDKALVVRDQLFTGCEPTCTAVDPSLCVFNPADPADCVECTAASHCLGNPAALGPKCDTSQNYCICENDGDCAKNRHGVRCDLVEQWCYCKDSTDCKTPPYTACDGTGECVTPP